MTHKNRIVLFAKCLVAEAGRYPQMLLFRYLQISFLKLVRIVLAPLEL